MWQISRVSKFLSVIITVTCMGPLTLTFITVLWKSLSRPICQMDYQVRLNFYAERKMRAGGKNKTKYYATGNRCGKQIQEVTIASALVKKSSTDGYGTTGVTSKIVCNEEVLCKSAISTVLFPLKFICSHGITTFLITLGRMLRRVQ